MSGDPIPNGGCTRVRLERGQTSFDFFIGMSVFLLTVGAVFSFLPGVFEPFTTDSGADKVVADRSAARLAEDVLVEDPARPNVLNATCTNAFFTGGSPPAGCRFDTTDTEDTLGVVERTNVNITIEDGASITHSKGDSPPDSVDVTVAQRSVLLADNQQQLVVRVW